jgi:hypothetical protein
LVRTNVALFRTGQKTVRILQLFEGLQLVIRNLLIIGSLVRAQQAEPNCEFEGTISLGFIVPFYCLFFYEIDATDVSLRLFAPDFSGKPGAKNPQRRALKYSKNILVMFFDHFG